MQRMLSAGNAGSVVLLRSVPEYLILGTPQAMSWKCFNSLLRAGRKGQHRFWAGSQFTAVRFQSGVLSPGGVTERLQQMMDLTPQALHLSVKWRLILFHLLISLVLPHL